MRDWIRARSCSSRATSTTFYWENSSEGTVCSVSDYGTQFGKLSLQCFQDIIQVHCSLFHSSQLQSFRMLENVPCKIWAFLIHNVFQIGSYLETFNVTWYNDVTFILIQSLDLCTCMLLRFIMVTPLIITCVNWKI